MGVLTSIPGSADSMLGAIVPGLPNPPQYDALTFYEYDMGYFAIFNDFTQTDAGKCAFHTGFSGPFKHVDFQIPSWGEFPSGPVGLSS